MYRRILRSVREFRTPTVITFLCMVFEAGIECVIPFITARLINGIRTGEELSDVIKTGLILAGMAMVSLFCGWMGGIACARASAGFSRNLRNDLFAKIQSFSFESVDKFSSASLVTRLTTDVGYAGMAYMMVIRTAIRSPLMFIFAVIMAYIMGGALSMTFVVVIPLLAFGLLIIARFAMPAFRRVFRKYDKLNESIEENVRGMRIVKGFSREEYEKEKFGKASDNIRKDFTKAEKIVAMNNPLMQICMNFNMVFVLLVGSKMIVSSGAASLDVGHMSSMLTYGMQILMSLMMLSIIYVILTMSAESFRRIDEVLREESSIVNPENPVFEMADGSVDFENVSFKYSSEAHNFALEGVNLHIPSGATVGILGGTGSSKSTLVQLISRLYDTTEGSVKVGGVDVRKYDLDTLRQNVSMVLQKNMLFSGTIRENLLWGDAGATDEEIAEACSLAQASEFISGFADGYDTFIEQGGTNVSGGQKQRLCIARALLRRPKILILDDSTSAVDTHTDSLIRDGFRKYIPETTKIIIAQRVASVMDADMIIIMDGGRIADVGTHQELLERSPIYSEVYTQQLFGKEAE
ncbi:MAG: ABC transporter ATP-binding protein/permease [Clostridiales bacterium]|nr:ABC transporter ATP-binding protein/permease [Clostridiales bacterium]